MKILHVVRQFYPCVGGIERFTLDLCHFTVSRGHQCEVLTLDRDFATGEQLPPRGDVDGIAIRRIPYFGPRRYRMAPTALGQLGDCDLLHVHCVDFFVDFLALTRPLHRRPLLLSTHGGFFHSAWGGGIKQLFFRTVTPLSLRGVDRVVCDSQQDFDLFAPVAPNRCRLIENGVDYDSFAGLQKKVRPGLLVHVGRTDANKRLDLLIRTFALVARRRPEARLALVGPDWLGEWPRLRQVAADEGIADRVEFVGRVGEAELKRWLVEAHFFVSASAYEGFGIAAVEAMATGTVPILSDIVAFRNLTQGGNCGKLADFDHPSQAAETILRALDLSPVHYEEISVRARTAASSHSWQAVGERFLSLYGELAGSRSPAQAVEGPGQ